jgi:3-hydroxy-D-aspartate aldolase
LRGWEERRQALAGAADKAGRTRDLFTRHGIECPSVTGAGTGTFEFESASGVYTELQCGSYIFMDADYGRNLDRDGAPTKAFEPSLFVWATVMSRQTDDRAIVDAGLKGLAFDSGPALVCDEPAAIYERASDQHGRLGISGRHQPPQYRRQDPPRPRPLRPDRQPLRLVCLHPRQPRRAALADHGAWCGLSIS